MFNVKHFLVAAAAASCVAPAFADYLPDFTVNTASASAGGSNLTFSADKITGNYTETITFTPMSLSGTNVAGSFALALKWDAGQFVANDGTTVLRFPVTGLDQSYELNATFDATGAYTFDSATGVSQFNLGSGMLNVYTRSVSAGGVYGANTLIATGNGVSGQGNIACIGGNNCGSFGQTTTFTLTDAGKNFFVAPSPFYMFSMQSGQLNGFTPSNTVIINGSLDVTFVPEPGSIALVGVALAGLGLARRRKAAVAA